MTDRVHPMHQTHYQHADAGLPPSAPPLDGTAVGIPMPMPEKAIRMEQQESLISQYENAQTRKKDDHIYATPPPVYPSYGEKGHTQSYPMTAAAEAGHRRIRQRSRCCCFLISFVVTLGTLLLIAGVVALVVYLVVRPVKEPKYEIKRVEVKEFNMTSQKKGEEEEPNTEMNLKLEARNGNKKIGIDYSEIEVKVYYMEEEIGEGSIPGFYQGHKNTTLLTIPIKGEGVELTSTADASMLLTARGSAKARIKIGRWKSRRHTVHVICPFQLSTRGPHPTLLSPSSCNLKLRKFFFLRSLF